MPRKPRFYLPDVSVRIVHRGHSKELIFLKLGTLTLAGGTYSISDGDIIHLPGG